MRPRGVPGIRAHSRYGADNCILPGFCTGRSNPIHRRTEGSLCFWEPRRSWRTVAKARVEEEGPAAASLISFLSLIYLCHSDPATQCTQSIMVWADKKSPTCCHGACAAHRNRCATSASTSRTDRFMQTANYTEKNIASEVLPNRFPFRNTKPQISSDSWILAHPALSTRQCFRCLTLVYFLNASHLSISQ